MSEVFSLQFSIYSKYSTVQCTNENSLEITPEGAVL